MMSFPLEQHAPALPTHCKMRGVDTITQLHRGNWEKNILPTLPLSCCMLIVPSDIHLHNGAAKKRLPRLILLMQLDYCLCACDN